jgi:Tol biopolymer transport system component
MGFSLRKGEGTVRAGVAICISVAVGLACAVIAAASDGVRPSSTGGNEPGLFAYEALTGGVFLIRADGTGNREIVPDAHNPAWSQDGSRLMYDRTYGMGGLWWSRPDGSDPQFIIGPGGRGSCNTEFGAIDGAWATSGRQVAFVGVSEDAQERAVFEICTASRDGSRVRRLGTGAEPDWFPGGRRIAFIAPARSRQSFSSRIATVRSDGRGLRVLLGDGKGFRSSLDVSPDGHRLAFLETSSAPGWHPTELRIMNLQTGRTRTIPWTKTGLRINDAVWTPGGTRIAYLRSDLAIGQRVPPSSVYTIRSDGTARKPLFTLPFEEYRGLWGESLSWQPSRR